MKISKIILLILLISFFNTWSQEGHPPRISNEKREQIKSMKIAFITSALALTPEESEKFWPIYNTYEEKQHQIRKKKFKSFLDDNEKSLDKISEKEASNLLSMMEKNEEEMYQNKRSLITNLKGVISPVKILKLKKAEEDFNRKLLRQYKKKE